MPQARYDILGLGNAIVDVIAQTPDAFLVEHKLNKGAMALIDEAPAETLYGAMGNTVTISGGSAANTVIGAASFGCAASFIGKVKDDELGELFTTDIRKAGIDFPVPHANAGPATARCLDHGDARWPAHDEHVPRRLPGPDRGRRRSRRR